MPKQRKILKGYFHPPLPAFKAEYPGGWRLQMVEKYKISPRLPITVILVLNINRKIIH